MCVYLYVDMYMYMYNYVYIYIYVYICQFQWESPNHVLSLVVFSAGPEVFMCIFVFSDAVMDSCRDLSFIIILVSNLVDLFL